MHPWRSVCCTWPLPCPSPHPLRGDTAPSLPASCTHLMFLCRFSCGLVCLQGLVLFDSPGSHRNCGFCFEAGHLAGNRIRQIENRRSRAPNTRRSDLLLTHCLSTLYTLPLSLPCTLYHTHILYLVAVVSIVFMAERMSYAADPPRPEAILLPQSVLPGTAGTTAR